MVPTVRPLIVVASASGHSMKVFKDRKLFATWPISTGRPGKLSADQLQELDAILRRGALAAGLILTGWLMQQQRRRHV